jgi:hypothetical protein
MVRLRHRQQQPTQTQAPMTPSPDVYPIEPASDDHGLHVTDETCARCGRAIGPTDEARRTASGGCVHLCC